MKYKIEKDYDFGLWYGYRWDDRIFDWEFIGDICCFTRIGCKHAVKRWHKKRLKKITKSEVFELE